MVKSVYIHIPFCKDICSYCAFCKVYKNKILIKKYLKALEIEIKSCYKNEKIETIYVGGGTPSCLDIEDIEYLLRIIDNIKKDKDLEYTFECNIEIEEEKLLLLKKYGVNRLSFGIETVQDRLLKIIDRKHTKDLIKEKIKLCRNIGFNNINIDLMYAFYDEDIKELTNDISFILSLDVEHISTYSLMIEPHTKLFINNYKSCDEEKDELMYKKIHSTLEKKGFSHYEVSNFAKEGYQSKHNLVYWKNKEYYGFGLSASGYINNERYKNTCSLKKYLDNNFKYETIKLEKCDKISYEMILGLRLKDGVDLSTFYKKYHITLEEVYDISDYLRLGYLRIKNNFIYIPFDKWYVMNSILERFV